MNINKKAMMMLVGVACAALTVSAGVGKNSDLNLGSATTNTVAATSTSPTTVDAAPGWTNNAPMTVQALSNSEAWFFEIDNDCVSSNVSKYAMTATTTKYVESTFDMLAAAVPSTTTSLSTTFDATPQLAFCIWDAHGTGDDAVARSFWAYVKPAAGGDAAWTNLGACNIADDTAYALKITFDYHDSTKYVKFAISNDTNKAFTDLTTNSVTWYQVAAPATGVSTYAFAGDGYVKNFATATYELESEDVTIPDDDDTPAAIKGKKVVIEEESKAAADTTATSKGYDSTAAFMAADAKTAFGDDAPSTLSGTTVAEAYALGIVTTNDTGTAMVLKDNGKVLVQGEATAMNNDGDIVLGMNIEPPEGAGTVTYQLKGSANGTDWTNIGSASETVPTIPTDNVGTGTGKYRYFKVDVSVTLPDAN